MPACVVAAALALVAITLGWRGGDWPAQLYRVDLFRRAGFTQWDNYWYGGHHAPGYSLLYPPLGAVFGITITAVVSAVAATWSFAAMARRWLPAPRAASIVFGAGTVTNIAVGRLTFALGLAVGMTAVAAMTSGRRGYALLLAPLTVMASPVAGVFVMLAATAWALAARPVRRLGIGVTLGAAVTLVAIGLAFPEGGEFPFGIDAFVITGAVGLLAVIVLPRGYGVLRLGGALYALAAFITVVVPNPLGANITRLGMYTAAPIVVGALWPERRRVAAALAGPLLAWQWLPAADAIFTAGLDPSSDPAYYDGLLVELDHLPPGRVEIPFTKHHWEATYVAPHAALARGWERQLDIGVNPIFYERELSAATYQRWLDDNAIAYVALPDADLDDSALLESELLRRGVPGLEPVWHDGHWQLWRVTTAKPLVEGAALVELDADAFTLQVAQPGDVLVRIHYSSHWDVDGPGCAVPTIDDWTRIRFASAGTWRVRQVVSRWIPFDADSRFDDCPAVG
ncbi:MAG: hypothetical protein QOG30_2526 [Acidimicrobiaceae bacterium]